MDHKFEVCLFDDYGVKDNMPEAFCTYFIDDHTQALQCVPDDVPESFKAFMAVMDATDPQEKAAGTRIWQTITRIPKFGWKHVCSDVNPGASAVHYYRMPFLHQKRGRHGSAGWYYTESNANDQDTGDV
jgi:hypothetical protein